MNYTVKYGFFSSGIAARSSSSRFLAFSMDDRMSLVLRGDANMELTRLFFFSKAIIFVFFNSLVKLAFFPGN